MTTALQQKPLKVAVIGNPNTGKSTLFNALAGLHTHVGNYPGVTVEKKIGRVAWDDRPVCLIDLPGTYSLSPRSLDELISVDVLLGQQPDVGTVDVVLCIADAAHLERHLFLLSQILDTGVPTVLVLNMWDAAERAGLKIDVEQLQSRLGIPVVTTEAHRRRGIDRLPEAVNRAIAAGPAPPPRQFPQEFYEECDGLDAHLQSRGQADVPWFLRERLLLDVGGTIEQRYVRQCGEGLLPWLRESRSRLAQAGFRVPAGEPEHRYRWAREMLQGIVISLADPPRSLSDRLDGVLTHRVLGLGVFLLLMFVVFQAIYAWAEPMMGWCEEGQAYAAGLVEAAIPPGPLRSLLVDGVIAGVGGVVIFLPQILLLFLLIGILEDCGYMARGAYLMDRVMRAFGLSGKSFLPLMSSFACAVPGIMATRVIDNPRDRMVTILVAPLMSCSARLPVYLLLIGAFVPTTAYLGGWVSLQGLVLFAMSSLGLVLAVPIAWVLKRLFFPGAPGAFVMELPDYKVPSPRMVLYRMYERGMAFLTRAGTLIFAATIVVWALGYFPGDHSELDRIDAQLEAVHAEGVADADRDGERLAAQESVTAGEPAAAADAVDVEMLKSARNAESARLVRVSYLGRAGEAIEPIVRPLGWDWRIGVGVLASFPAREVIIATLGTIYSLGGDVNEESEGLRGALQSSTWPDGRPVYNIPVALSLMVFFALCAQCASTLMIIRRETNSWRWAAFSFIYMTTLAYFAALVTYQVGIRI